LIYLQIIFVIYHPLGAQSIGWKNQPLPPLAHIPLPKKEISLEFFNLLCDVQIIVLLFIDFVRASLCPAHILKFFRSLILSPQRDNQRVKLVTYWLDIVTQLQNERNAKETKSDASKDPLAASGKKGELNAVLGGGFTIDHAGKQRAKRLYASSSLADVHTYQAHQFRLLILSLLTSIDVVGWILPFSSSKVPVRSP